MEKRAEFSEYLFAKMPDENHVKIECTEEFDKAEEVMGWRKWFSDNLLLVSTILGVALGAVLGFGLRPFELSTNSILLISYPGEIFMRLLKLIILPLIISSLVAGSASLNARLNGRIAVRTLIYFLLTSIINAILGVLVVVLVHPGHPGLKTDLGEGTEDRKGSSMLDSLLDLGRNIVADNIFQATFEQAHTTYVNTTNIKYITENESFVMTQHTTRAISYRPGTNTLGIVFFCLIFGTILGTFEDRSKSVIEFFTVVFEVVMKMVTGVMWLTPFGISSVIAGKILAVDDLALVLSNLAWFIATVILGVLLYQLIIMQLIYFLVIRKNPFKFYLGLVQGMLTAFATASTAAALPITFRLMENDLKVDSRVTRFVLPIGCNINMDGTACFVAIASVFIAQMNGITLGLGELITVCFTSTAASFSSASVPSAALVLLLMVLSAIDTPVQDVSLLFAIDWIVDRFRTTNNMLGDCYAAAVVEHLSKKELMACDAIFQESSNFDESSPTMIKTQETVGIVINDCAICEKM